MAISPAHQFGQAIGYLLEYTMLRHLAPIAKDLRIYLDYKHPRAARNGKSDVVWHDTHGNSHKLDIVFERNGSESKIGNPVAFVEIAWRRYTKHSKNKVQEIAGAILPVVQVHAMSLPFYGVVLAGDFTDQSIQQLKSEGFRVLYFPLATIEQTYKSIGIDVHWEEDTPELEISQKAQAIFDLSDRKKRLFASRLIKSNKVDFELFCQQIRSVFARTVTTICISTFYGHIKALSSIESACQYISQIPAEATCDFIKFDIEISYSSGEKNTVTFNDAPSAISYLRTIDR